MKKLLIFDLDGTLVNTVVDLNNSLNYAFNKNGFASKPVEHTSKAIGNGISITIYRSLPEDISKEEHDRCFSDFRSHYRSHYLDHSFPYKGMFETLITLKNRGYLLAVATNKLDEIAKDMVNHFFPNIFDIIQGDKPDIPKKPDPTLINDIVSSLGVDKSNVTYLGDSEVDIESANNAEVGLILVDYGFHRREDFLTKSSGKHISNPQELLNIFK